MEGGLDGGQKSVAHPFLHEELSRVKVVATKLTLKTTLNKGILHMTMKVVYTLIS